MKFENFLKGLFTTLVGIALMIISIYEYLTGEDGLMQTGLIMVAGFALLFMRDKISDFISELAKRALNKWFPPKAETPEPPKQN